MKLNRLALFCVVAFGAPAALNADPISFDFRGGWWPRVAKEMTFQKEGLSVKVNALRDGSQKYVVRGKTGLGVWSGFWDSPAVDGSNGINEALRFEFDPAPVALETVTFSLACNWHGSADNFMLSIDGSTVIASAVVPSHPGVYDVSFALGGVDNVGQVFEFSTTGATDDWTIARMSVSLANSLTAGGVAVPEPGSLLLLGLGAGGVGLLSRRRRRRQQQS